MSAPSKRAFQPPNSKLFVPQFPTTCVFWHTKAQISIFSERPIARGSYRISTFPESVAPIYFRNTDRVIRSCPAKFK